VTDEARQPELPTARVATRPGASGVAEKRRRIYQRHLLIFLAVNGGIMAADLYTSPGSQWAYYLVVPWFLIFLMHTAGLKSRGYSIGEMLIPPRERPIKEVYTVPLDYELVRARQLRDGVANAAAAVRQKDAKLADRAVAAADQLVVTLEGMVAAARSGKHRSDERAEQLVPEGQAALDALDQLHQGLLRVGVMEESEDAVPTQAVEERAAALRQLAE
jgi:2TM domain